MGNRTHGTWEIHQSVDFSYSMPTKLAVFFCNRIIGCDDSNRILAWIWHGKLL